MSRIRLLFTTLSIIGLLMTPSVLAQPRMGQGSGGWGMGGQYQRLYNPQTSGTVTGEVVAVDTVTPLQGMSRGVHLRVRTQNREDVSVHLGPSWYLNNQDLQVRVGDRITAKGSRVTVAGQPTLIAAEVQKGDQVLRLRDNQGFPVWSAWRGQPRSRNQSIR